jgi:hypothetical protein
MTPGPRSRANVLGPADWMLLAALLPLHAILRLGWASGLGLGDDVNLRTDIASIVHSGHVMASPKAYRVTWWLPTVLSARWFGLADVGLILPILIASTLGAGVLYALGTRLYSRAGGLIAAALLLVHPLDFAWSTMLAEDIVLSAASALAVLLVLRALDADDVPTKRGRWALAGVGACAAFYAKISAVFLAPAFLAIAWLRRDRVDRHVWVFVATVLGLLAVGAIVAYAFTGDPLAPYSYEIRFQGLDRAADVARRRVTSEVFWRYPRFLFARDQLGDLVHSVYPWLAVGLVLASPFVRLRTSGVTVCWFLSVFLGYQLNVRRMDGLWVTGFRNIRHSHVFVYPLLLVVAGYLTSLLRTRPRLAIGVLALVLAFSLCESIRTADRTRPVFRELREAGALVASLPRRPIWADFHFHNAMVLRDLARGRWRATTLGATAAERAAQIAAIRAGYLVTGGAREPYYGCRACIARAAELDPSRWRLVHEWQAPPPDAPWWPEPLRLWERTTPAR